MRRLLTIALALIYSGFLTAVVACPMEWLAPQHKCCREKKPVCPLGNCFGDSASAPAANPPAKHAPTLALAPPELARWEPTITPAAFHRDQRPQPIDRNILYRVLRI